MLTDGPRAQEPVYAQVDGAGDNTFDALPAALAGAQRIADTLILTNTMTSPVVSDSVSTTARSKRFLRLKVIREQSLPIF